MNPALAPRQGLVMYMAMLAGAEPTGWLELRHRRNDDRIMRQRFFDAAEPNAAAIVATVLSQSGDVYIGCAPRREKAGGKQAVEHGSALWVDCDDPAAVAALERFEPQPPVVVRTSARGRHAYWPLMQPLAAAELERANRRLAYALGACQSAVTNAAAVLRPPVTRNWKYQPPQTVILERHSGERLRADQVAGPLPDPPVTQPRGRGGGRRAARGGDPLLAIAPAVYVEALTGRPVGRDGKVACPLHRDSQPSLHAYPQPAQGWACFSAHCWRGDRPNGGDIYDLAAQLWLTGHSPAEGGRRPLRGREFLQVRERLLAMFFGEGKAA